MMKSAYQFVSNRFQTVFLDYKVDFKPRFGHGNGPHPELQRLISDNDDVYREQLAFFAEHSAGLATIQRADDVEDETNEPVWENGFLPALDIVALYGMLARHEPKRYVEIGSGNSTKVARKSITDHGLATQIISIDPMPRANIDHLADQVVRSRLEDLGPDSAISQLEPGDVLFIDNSHRTLPNSDVTVCFLEILPRLPKGVIVHLHDIFLPEDYPPFMCERAYSEQYMLAAILLANPQRYFTVLPNYYLSMNPELAAVIQPMWDATETLRELPMRGGSYWLEIR